METAARPWPKNAWYVACTPDEITDKPLGRQICGEHMVLFRGELGKARALEDFCPHRGAPLSLGFVREGQLVCGYHGLSMGCDGQTKSMPGQRVSSFPVARTFAAMERYGFIWVWPGDQDQADPALIPHQAWADSPDWAYGGGLFHIKCDYRLMIDNLMDLTHETYVHSSSIGQKEIDEAPVMTEVINNQVITRRHMEKITAPPFWAMAMRAAGLPEDHLVDRWQICRFSLPSNVMIEVGVALEGQGGYDAPDDVKAASIVVDFITPETETTHWYFWGMARSFKPDDAELTAAIRKGQHSIFSEDLEMLERQQKNLQLNPDRRLLRLNIDAGGVRSRMSIDRAIAQERAATLQT